MLCGMSVKDANKALEDLGLVLKLDVENEKAIDKKNTYIKEQIPKQGIMQESGGEVMCKIEIDAKTT